ncbi:hypothetical protein PB01_15880 [Psychrobacillus glaciei]|uniref:Uncharacterized protein n=1 Tax=Psychrobacillus glaciei TaxID=2283160 RepID=A0A5J6SRA9_9BACI|nr:hypothetical protein PB01_15880 [Psychrobacillus glaciei]
MSARYLSDTFQTVDKLDENRVYLQSFLLNLTTLVFEPEKLYVIFKIRGPIVSAKISETELEKLEDLFFNVS